MKYQSNKTLKATAFFLATILTQPLQVFAQQGNSANSGNNGKGNNGQGNANENSNENSGSGNNNSGGNSASSPGLGGNISDAPTGQTSVTTESNPMGEIILTGTVDDLSTLNEIGFQGAIKLLGVSGGVKELKKFISGYGSLKKLVDRAGNVEKLLENFVNAKNLEGVADDLLGEAADLINNIFQDATISSGTLDSGRLFDRASLFSNSFNTQMIALAAEFSGNIEIGQAIEDALNNGNLNDSNGWVGNLTEVLSNSSNANLLGTRSHKIGGLLDLTTDDFEAYAGKDVTIEAGSHVDLSAHSTKILAIVGGDDLHIAGDVTFSDRSSTWDKETLAIGAADQLTIADGSTVNYNGNYLGLGASSSINLVNVTLSAGSGVGVGSLKDVSITDGIIELTNSKGGAGFFADEQLAIDGLTFVGNLNYVYMEARTINLSNIDFPAGSSIDLVSELGPIDGKYPNFGNSIPGMVNFLTNVSYGGTSNVMHDKSTFDQFGQNIQIMSF
jgi:hypothetical protein